VLHKGILWRIYGAGDNKTYLGAQVKRPVFLPGFKQI
jgi:hypothetical protein